MVQLRALSPILLLTLAILFLFPVSRSYAQTPNEGITITQCLAIKLNVRGGRLAIHTDPLEAKIVAGVWKSPQNGESVPMPNGSASQWTSLKADANGAFQSPLLGGGYAYAEVEFPAAKTMLLEAAGHSMVYVNGEPRIGDVYRYGYTRLPVPLRAGKNTFLFSVARGGFSAKISPLTKPVLLHTADSTLPDLLLGERKPHWGAIIILNGTDKPLTNLRLVAQGKNIARTTTPIPAIPPFGLRKVGFLIGKHSATEAGNAPLTLKLFGKGGGKPLDTAALSLRVRDPLTTYKRTFISQIDGSVQYYAVNPARPNPAEKTPPAFVLTLHGASVEALGQADAYSGKTWAHLVAPTNRRPYGFDWEDWGRLDTLEVLENAQSTLNYDPQRVYLTGHSMGGHGTWQTGVTFPDKFAAIAPSAGWISFVSYAGGQKNATPSPLEALLQRASLPSDTLALKENLQGVGVYILHGGADDNVPATEAQEMNRQLASFHKDYNYFEQPNAGHWWDNSDEPGADCVDWLPLFDFFSRRALPTPQSVREVRFSTASPGVSSQRHWARIEAQTRPFVLSSVRLQYDPGQRRFSGTTENVARLALNTKHVSKGDNTATPSPIRLVLDGQTLSASTPAQGETLWLERGMEGEWRVGEEPSTNLKNPRRYGPFKEAFRNRVVLVYGTKGTPQENAWAMAKARYDAETFWYRGNGSLEIVADTAFDPNRDKERNVILYGNSETNGAWSALLSQSPIKVTRGEVRAGDHITQGDDLACLFLAPRPQSTTALVGAVSGTGMTGLRLTDRIPYFVSGVAYPDFTLLSATSLQTGVVGVKGAGFFGPHWEMAQGEFVWNP